MDHAIKIEFVAPHNITFLNNLEFILVLGAGVTQFGMLYHGAGSDGGVSLGEQGMLR